MNICAGEWLRCPVLASCAPVALHFIPLDDSSQASF